MQGGVCAELQHAIKNNIKYVDSDYGIYMNCKYIFY